MRIHTMQQHLDDGAANPVWSEIRKGKLTASPAKVLLSYTPVMYRVMRPTGTLLKGFDDLAVAEAALEAAAAKSKMEGEWTIDRTEFISGPGRETYLSNVAAEGLGLQRPEFIPPTYWMERGLKLEAEARGWFQVATGIRVRQCGFIEDDDGLAGFSPDGYILEGDAKTLDSVEERLIEVPFLKLHRANQVSVIPTEFKVPKPSTHLKWLKAGILPDEHKDQVHFDMAITGSDHAWFMSYCPQTEPLLIRVERDEYTEKMVVAIDLAKRDLIEYRGMVRS